MHCMCETGLHVHTLKLTSILSSYGPSIVLTHCHYVMPKDKQKAWLQLAQLMAHCLTALSH